MTYAGSNDTDIAAEEAGHRGDLELLSIHLCKVSRFYS